MKCPECGGKEIVYKKDSTYCKKCGLVLEEDLIYFGKEWREYGSEENLSRAGPPQRETDIEIRSFISKKDIKNKKFRRLNYKNNQSSSSIKKNLFYGIKEIKRICSIFQTPEYIIDETTLIFKKGLEKGVVKAMNLDKTVLACIYHVLKSNGITRSLREFEEICDCNRFEIAKAHSCLCKKIKLKPCVTNPEEFVPRFCSKLNLKNSVTVRALRIINKNKTKIVGKSPLGVAAAAIYLACKEQKEHITQKSICKVMNLNHITLRNRMNDLK
jgi:transcription initiation factor TFIIB